MDKLQIVPFMLHDSDPLHQAAQADNHGVAAPTHVVFKGKEYIGYLSLGVVPTVLLWLDSKKCLVRDSIEVMKFYEQYMAEHNVSGILLPVPNKSPMAPYVGKVGYIPASPDTTIYFKSIIPTKG